MKTVTTPTTHAEEFRTVMVGHEYRKLFSVNAGLPIFDVLNEASCILDTARGVIREQPAGAGLEESTTFAVSNLLEQTAACLEALLGSPGLPKLEAALEGEQEQ